MSTDRRPERTPLAQLPTPLEAADRLRAIWGGPRLWIKRDDLTGFGLSGNKVRKLEYQLGKAAADGVTTLVTCGAVQSNHCRATAIAAARVGLRCVLVLRSSDGHAPAAIEGNHLLQRLAGAEVHFITPKQWLDRQAVMAELGERLEAQGEIPRLIPAGASDRLGMFAFEDAAHELSDQITAQLDGRKTTVWHASSSAGTTAGLALGARHASADMHIVGSSVGETRAELTEMVQALLAKEDAADAPFEIVDEYVGLGYGKTTDEELAVQVEATRVTGMIWDPTYTGKALFALRQEIAAGRFTDEDDVVFWHTGGGFAAFAHDFSGVLD